MNLSASQLETAKDCKRKWRFIYPDRMPVYKKGHFGFGTCLHGVAERFLKGETNLYPPGWDIDPDTKTRLDPKDSALIVALIKAGIEAGYLEQRPGGKVEAGFRLAVDGHIINGKIDYHSVPARRVEDHKTAKNDAYIKKTGKALAKNLQMMIYAKALLEDIRSRGEVDPRIVTLAHNQFLKDGPTVRRTEGEVTTTDIETYWNDEVRPLVKDVEAASKAASAFDLPMADARACNAYGGCPFLSVCGGQESVLQYTSRVSNMISTRAQSSAPTPSKEPSPVSSMDQFLKSRAQQTAQSPVTVNPPATAATTPATVAAVADQAQVSVPPWHSKTCPKCSPRGVNAKHPGFDANGTTCRVCRSLTRVADTDYEWETAADGSVSWWKKGARSQTVATTPAQEAGDKGSKTHYTIDSLMASLKAAKGVDEAVALLEEATETLGQSPELDVFLKALESRIETLSAPAEDSDATKALTVAEKAAVAEAVETEEKKKRTRRTKAEMEAARAAEAAAAAPAAPEPSEADALPTPQMGFILAICCAPVGRSFPGMETVLAEDLLSELPNYWGRSDVFVRRDELQRLDWQRRLGGCTVVVSGRSPDTDALVSALKPRAAVIMIGTMV